MKSYENTPEWRAKRGYPYGGVRKTKKRATQSGTGNGTIVFIKIPPGTMVRKKRSVELIADLAQQSMKIESLEKKPKLVKKAK